LTNLTVRIWDVAMTGAERTGGTLALNPKMTGVVTDKVGFLLNTVVRSINK